MKSRTKRKAPRRNTVTNPASVAGRSHRRIVRLLVVVLIATKVVVVVVDEVVAIEALGEMSSASAKVTEGPPLRVLEIFRYGTTGGPFVVVVGVFDVIADSIAESKCTLFITVHLCSCRVILLMTQN